jgi:DNA-binding NtrC family response regulator
MNLLSVPKSGRLNARVRISKLRAAPSATRRNAYALQRILKRVGHTVTTARDSTEALAVVSEQPLDLVLADIQMPGINGLELVRQIHEIAPDLPCIVITGYGTPQNSVDALRAGAFWYLEKPFDQGHLDVVRALVDQAIELGRLKSENRILQKQLCSRYGFESIVGNSAALRSALDVVRKVADVDSTVLVTGESGTGKELIARAIHYNSRRGDRMFVTVNCGAIPEELLESELFGHVRGAFTSAISNREGRFLVAHEGSIFLDEIVDVRVIAATNQNLEEAIREKRFREDLFFRLNVIPIEVPPLRERPEDIPLLAYHFLDIANRDKNTSVEGFSQEALDLIGNYRWPGNVRELENLIERLIVTRGGTREIGASDLPKAFHEEPSVTLSTPQVPSTGLKFREVVDDFEAELIRQALERTQWNKNRAAQLLGLNRTTLLEKIKKKGLEHLEN